jgi:hypothetical protein
MTGFKRSNNDLKVGIVSVTDEITKKFALEERMISNRTQY